MSDEAALEASSDAPEAPPAMPSPGSESPSEFAAGGALAIACPYLLSASGDWRSSSPVAEHRCTAFAPPAPLALDKQRRLCLTSTHETCATYLAALAARRERGTPSDGPSPTRWALARTTPVVDVGMGFGAAISGALTERRAWQAIPAIVLVLAVVALAASGLGRDRPQVGALTSPSPTIAASPLRTASPVPTTTPAPPSASPEATAPPTAAPTPAATPVVTATPVPAQRTYTVKRNDTLYNIAITYGTSVAAIKELNGLTSDVLHIGQVLKIPG